MKHKNWMLFGLLGVFIVLLGCSGLREQRRAIQYFTLEYKVPKMSGQKALPAVIKVERFNVAPTYNTQRMIYRDKAFKRDEYYYYKWRSNPGDTIAYLLSRDIGESGLFAAVLSNDSRFPFEFKVEGRVNEFLQKEEKDSWYADLSLTITLLKANDPDVVKRILFQKTYRAQIACPEENPQGLAQAMSEAMKEISQEIVEDVYQAVKRHMKVKK
ncbi:MAG: ABC-type transport auxiliary lipoprotein family protein [Deltaproteobacteria bacterium]|jgi:ABC-type uncharacterized transport system auxiliary subunit